MKDIRTYFSDLGEGEVPLTEVWQCEEALGWRGGDGGGVMNPELSSLAGPLSLWGCKVVGWSLMSYGYKDERCHI